MKKFVKKLLPLHGEYARCGECGCTHRPSSLYVINREHVVRCIDCAKG